MPEPTVPPLKSAPWRIALDRVDWLALFPIFTAVAWLWGQMAVAICIAFVLPVLIALRALTAQERLSTPAHRTDTTRVPNRQALEAMLDETLGVCDATGRATATILVQIEDLHIADGEWGAQMADTVMQRLADRLAVTLRNNDTIARCGPNLLGMVLNPVRRADLETSMGIVDRLQAAVEEPISIEGRTVRVTCCIGLCTDARAPSRTGAAMLAAADCALRDARRADPGAVRAFTTEMQHQVETEHQLAGQVAEALEKGDIRPWFQPQVSTDTGVITGFEALARWHHPDLGVLPPAVFLPAIAAAGRFAQLGEVMLHHTLRALKSWDAAGLTVPTVGLNLSVEELRDPRLADCLIWQVDRYDLAADRVCIEILESVTLKDGDEAIIGNLKTLRDAEFRLDLDDFGTGHASIAHIARFGVHRIKIDRSFVAGVDQDPNQKRLISAILSMAERLGIETLAEGVETSGEHSALAQLGCTHVQGYGVSRPMPFEDTIGWATAHNAKLAKGPTIQRRLG